MSQHPAALFVLATRPAEARLIPTDLSPGLARGITGLTGMGGTHCGGAPTVRMRAINLL